MFLVLYSFTQTPLYHLTGLPVLVQHYYEHTQLTSHSQEGQYSQKHSSSSISFLDFLELHYFGSEANLHPEHQPLPFKSVNINFHSIFCGELEFFDLTQQVQLFNQTFKPQDNSICPIGLAQGVWHPPKQA
jgi:hypothetical protein